MNYHDTSLVDFLASEWPLDFTSSNIPTLTLVNHAKDWESQIQIMKFIYTELSHSVFLGPFPAPSYHPWCQVSPIMTRPKKNTMDLRVVVDLNFHPAEASMQA